MRSPYATFVCLLKVAVALREMRRVEEEMRKRERVETEKRKADEVIDVPEDAERETEQSNGEPAQTADNEEKYARRFRERPL